MSPRVIYLLHFTAPLARARHYLGSTDDLEARLALHRAGGGARILEVAMSRGIGWELARTWEGDRRQERRLKRRNGHGRALCPICRAGSGRPIRGSLLATPSPGQPW